MTPQPIGAGAYGVVPTQATAGRRVDVAKFQQDITRALNADEANALTESFGEKAAVRNVKQPGHVQATLGGQIDIRV